MDKQYYTIKEISQFLSLKQSSLYSKAKSGQIPHYQIGRLIRFKLTEVEQWMQTNRTGTIDSGKKAGELLKSIHANPKLDVNRIVKRAIDEGKRDGYTGCHGKPDQIKNLRKEVEDGTL
jgi:excisionase family DNA binding protein